jgi:hypothetical protein
MKKIITLYLLGISTILYAGDGISCIDMSEKEFSRTINKYQHSINLSHFKTENITKIDKKHINNTLKNSINMKKCIHLRNIKIYDNNDDRKYRSLIKLQNFILTNSEKNFHKNTIKESRKYFKNHSNSSLINKNSCSYPLLYLTAQNSKKGGVIVYEYRLVNGKVEQYHKRVYSMQVKPTCGDNRSIANYIAYLNIEKGKKFTLEPLKNSIDIINKKVKENINRQKHHNISNEYMLINDLHAKSFIKNNIYITIPKGEIIEYNRHFNEDIVFLYQNEKYIITISQWRKSMKGDGNVEF